MKFIVICFFIIGAMLLAHEFLPPISIFSRSSVSPQSRATSQAKPMQRVLVPADTSGVTEYQLVTIDKDGKVTPIGRPIKASELEGVKGGMVLQPTDEHGNPNGQPIPVPDIDPGKVNCEPAVENGQLGIKCGYTPPAAQVR